MKHVLLSTAIFSCLSFGANIAIADSTPNSHSPGKWEFSASVANVSLDTDIANENFIEDSAFAFGFTADYDYGKYLASIGFDFISYDDNASFRQLTESNFGGNVENSKSDASAISFNLAIGPKWQVGPAENTLLYVQAGYAHVFESERSISNCSDCYSENIDVDGGLFAKAGFLQNIGSVGLGLYITQFLSDDGLDGSIGFTISSSY